MTKKTNSLGLVVGLALAGVFVMLLATRPGIGVYPDSISYFDAARNLASGRGLVIISGTGNELVPLTHYPPLYSSLLALASALGVTLETAARWLNAMLFGANIMLVGIAIRVCARDSFWLPVMGAFLVLTAPDVLAIHSVAMSEPLYLVLTMAGMLLLAAYLENQRRRLLLAAGIALSLSCLTRYVGVVGVGTGIIALLTFNRNKSSGTRFGFSFKDQSFRRRLVDTVILAAITCVPIGLWSMGNRLAAEGATDRHLAFHPIKFRQIVPAFSTAAQWLLLGKVRGDLRLLAFIIQVLGLAALAIYLYLKRIPLLTRRTGDDEEEPSRLPALLTLFAIFYVAFLVLIISFVEIDNVLDNRSLLPVHLAALVCVLSLARSLFRRIPESRIIRPAFVVLALLLAVSYTFRGARWLVQMQADGQGYASRAWKESPTIERIKELPSGIPIYSNGVDAIYYLSGRRAFEIPAKIIHGSAQPNPRYDAELQQMNDDLRTHNGVLVYFKTLPERWFLPLESELKSRLPLTEIALTPDGSLYRAIGQ